MLYENKFLRAFVLPALKAISRDITIRHHWTGHPIKLNLFAHKGYWYHGRRREEDEMRAIASLVQAGDVAVEVGGHIGYISLLLSKSVESGNVTVFEPGSNNLPYIRHNLAGLSNVTLIEKGCGPKADFLTFYEESLTGQNNSFVSSFQGLESNSGSAPNISVEVSQHKVPVVRLDEEIPDPPAFVKIDVEGFEYPVLQGTEGWFSENLTPPIIMIEVQADHADIADWFSTRGYQLFDIEANPITQIPETTINIFALNPKAHTKQLARWRDCRKTAPVV